MQVRIEKLIYGGDGLAHHDGHTVFVPFVLPEEVVAVREVERKKKFVRGLPSEIVTPSPVRAAAPCPHFTVCGGCHYQHIPYEAQLEFKAAILRETLGRLGGIQFAGPIATVASPPFAYRNRAQWKVGTTGTQTALGYEQAGSNKLCAIEQCAILAPPLDGVLASLRELVARGELPSLREVEAFADPATGSVLVNASFTRFQQPPETLAAAFRTAVPRAESVLLHESSTDRFELAGPGYIHYGVAGTAYRVGHLSFFQVNSYLIEAMTRAVSEGMEGDLALDLYAGVGLFSVPLRGRFRRVVAVESNPAAARDLEANLKSPRPGEAPLRSDTSTRVIAANVEKFVARSHEQPTLVVLDPPRTGLAPAVVEHLARLAPRRIRYLSCDPSTLARDVAGLVRQSAGAYEIDAVTLFDMFPQTYHIETLAELVRRA